MWVSSTSQEIFNTQPVISSAAEKNEKKQSFSRSQ